MRRAALPLLATLALAALVIGCDESLPPRLEPEAPLEFARVLANQGTSEGGIHVTVTIDVVNVYQETIEGEIDMVGEVRIWWKDRPDVEAHLPLAEQRYLRLDPGSRYRVETVWFLETDDGADVMNMLDYSAQDIRFGVIYARPETFVAEVSMTMFSTAGLRISGQREFTLEGWRILDDEYTVEP